MTVQHKNLAFIFEVKSYPMSLPRLGNAVIINNISSSMPGSEIDVRALKESFQNVGFEVHVCRDSNDKVTVHANN